MWTLVGSGHKTFAQTALPMAKAIPKGANWIKDSAATIDPEKNLVTTENGLEVCPVTMSSCYIHSTQSSL